MDRKPRLRVLHTSDVHLGAYDSSTVDQRKKLEAGFRRVIDVGLAESVDLMLIAGDFFDNARVRPETLVFAANEIARLEKPTVIGPGNHDHVGPGSVYDRFDLTSVAQNLRIIRDPEGEFVPLEDLDVEVWGKAHTEQLPRFEPFTDVPPRGDAAWQIGIGHGHYIHPKALLHHSFHIREQDLAASRRDYVALGHWEQLARVAAGEETVAAYSGAPEGLSGVNGGHVLIVDLFEDGDIRLTGAPLNGADPIDHDHIPRLLGLAEA